MERGRGWVGGWGGGSQPHACTIHAPPPLCAWAHAAAHVAAHVGLLRTQGCPALKWPPRQRQRRTVASTIAPTATAENILRPRPCHQALPPVSLVPGAGCAAAAASSADEEDGDACAARSGGAGRSAGAAGVWLELDARGWKTLGGAAVPQRSLEVACSVCRSAVWCMWCRASSGQQLGARSLEQEVCAARGRAAAHGARLKTRWPAAAAPVPKRSAMAEVRGWGGLQEC